MTSPDYDTSTGLRALKGDSFVADIDAGFLALATDVAAKIDLRGYAEVNTSQTTSSAGPVDLGTTGPSVTLTAATNGLLEVVAQATASAAGGATATVYLDEDGTNLGAILAITSGTPTTLYTAPGSATGTSTRVRSGALVIPVTTGSHTYKLRYGSDGFNTATFLTRRLWVRLLQP